MTRRIIQINAQADLEQLCNQVVESGEPIVIQRLNQENVVLLTEKDFSSLLETLYQFRSPGNATRLLNALQRAKAQATRPQSVDDLMQKLGLDLKEELEDEDIVAAS